MVAVLLLALQVVTPGRLSGVGLTVTITGPTSAATYDAGTATTLTLSGTAQSDRGVTVCTWVNSLGGSGTAAGLGSWTITSAALTVGSNVFTVTCLNNEGTSAQDVITVTASAPSAGQSTFVTCTTTLANLATATVQSAINAAADGAVICLPAGSAAWTGGVTFSLTKAVTIAGQEIVTGGSGTSTITGSSFKFTWPSGSSTKDYRVAGLRLTSSAGAWMVYQCPGGTCGTELISHFRIDHNIITMSAGAAIVFMGDGATKGYIFGVMDHNTVTSPAVFFAVYGFNQEDAAPPTSNALGASNNFFVENNTFNAATIDNTGLGCTDGWGAIAVVFRYNTMTNCRTLMHAVTHQGGPANFEVYGNTYIQTSNTSGDGGFLSDGTRTIHMQGAGTGMVFNNTMGSIVAHGGDGIVIQHYRSYGGGINGDGSDGASPYGQCNGLKSVDGNRATTAVNHGYPCWRQPARNIAGVYKPIGSWNNKWSSDNSRVDMAYNAADGPSDFTSSQMVLNREWYNGVSLTAQTSATSPFNGTTGVGFGTLALRPTTCTTSTETAFGNGAAGVMYFATDQGTWFNGGAGGVLYTCSATNTWTVYYTPYTYPYPWP